MSINEREQIEWCNSNLLCGFVQRGFCREGPSCQFSHDVNTAIPIPDGVCAYNLQSKCAYGDNCRFVHMGAKEICEAYYAEQYPYEGDCVTPDDYPLPNTSLSSPPQGDEGSGEPTVSALDCANSYNCDTSTTSHDENYEANDDTTIDANVTSSINNATCGTSRSYAEVCDDRIPDEEVERLKSLPLCPYIDCTHEYCDYLHGIPCDLCNRPILHPYDDKQRREHKEECVKEHEKQMELSFAIQRSIEKNCGICMDLVLEKEPPCERRFGILEKCNHTFCLSCIRKWRQTKQFDCRTIRSCPECRISSDFVIPSKFWVEDKEDKDKLIDEYKKALSLKPCKYFKQGGGECPFAGACFYLHAKPDGSKVELAPPRPRPRRHNSDSSASDYESARNMLLWNYVDARSPNDPLFLTPLMDLDEMMEIRHFLELLSSDEDDLEDSDLD